MLVVPGPAHGQVSLCLPDVGDGRTYPRQEGDGVNIDGKMVHHWIRG